jgi:hypothetical protein
MRVSETENKMRNQSIWIKRSTALLLASALVMALGCSSKPSRSVATKEIDHFFQGFDLPLMLIIGKIGKCAEKGLPDSDISYPVAEKLGYITVRAEGDKFWQVDLTEVGRAYLGNRKETPYAHEVSSCGDYSQVDFQVAQKIVTDISDITPFQEGQVLVTFKWKWAPTDVGKRLSPSGDVYQQLSSDQRHALLRELQFAGPEFEISDLADSAERENKLVLKKTDQGWTVRIK